MRNLNLTDMFKPALGLCLIASMIFASDGMAASKLMTPGKYKAELKYGLMLPDYCGGLYFNRKDAAHRMPPREICGVYTNHFCSGLINIYKAREAIGKKKVWFYKGAKKDVEYTKVHIEKYPRCPLHKDVNTALTEINMWLNMLGGN